MSRTTNGSNANAGGAKRAQTRRTTRNANHPRTPTSARLATSRARRRASEQTGKVIEERQCHQHRQHGHADALADLESAVGNRTALENLDEIIQQVSSVE